MTKRPDPRVRITRDELDRLFDRELDTCERRDLVGRLARDPAALDEVNDVRRIVNTMRLRPDESPDLTAAVLSRLDRERGFIPSRMRRRIKSARVAIAACALLGLLGVSVAHRLAPDRFRLLDAPTPVADLGNAVLEDSIEGRRVLAAAVEQLASASRESSSAPGLAANREAERSSSRRVESVSPRMLSERLDLPATSPTRFVMLTASSDAEVLALGSGTAIPGSQSSIAFAPFDAEALASLEADGPAPVFPGFAYAFAAFEPDGSMPGPQSGRARIPAGLVPLSFSGATRAAIVGKRSLFPERIEHAPDAASAFDAE